MHDLFGNEFREDQYIVVFIKNNNRIAKIKSIITDDSNNSSLQCYTSYSKWDTVNFSKKESLVYTENMIINDVNEQMNKIAENITSIINYKLEIEKAKEKKLNKKKDLTKNCKPGAIFRMSSYNKYYIYLGQEENKLHVYLHFIIKYNRNRPSYEFPYNHRDKLIVKCKSKKMPSEFITENIDVHTMFYMLKTNVSTVLGNGTFGNFDHILSRDEIDELEQKYNTLKGS